MRIPAPLRGDPGAGPGQVPGSPPVGLALGTRRTARGWDDSAASATHPWWDDAPVPPPVVVASADGRTPAVTFAPDADPFSAGGMFAPQGRDGEPPVVVHQAPDAAVLRTARRARSVAAPVTAVTDAFRIRALRDVDGSPDTGSLVRPYVAQVEACEPDEPAVGALAPAPAGGARRGRRSRGPLDRIIDATPAGGVQAAGEWFAPCGGDRGPTSGGRQPAPLFEPGSRGTQNPWTPPSHHQLPSRKALRARERAGAANRAVTRPAGTGGGEVGGTEPGGRVTGRRLAKSGVLAVTAVGVVAASAPNAFSALGVRLPSPSGAGAQAALVGFAGSGAIPAGNLSLSAPSRGALGVAGQLSAEQPDNAEAAARQNMVEAARQSAAAAARAGAVASGAGRTLVDVARDQVLAEAARKAAIAQQVSRNAVRDPRSYARLLLQERGWSDQFTCLNLLWDRESGWNYQAYNPTSGAYGIPQALPGSKMASIAPDWRTNPITQITWGLGYIAERYGTPCEAWAHSQATGWY
ncbi:MAG TPA: hypothetical protein VMT69_01985 [Kineosporiaceae bacterium]|nr:hypothetical protein [Kineosporiaceae bacterium]